MCVTASSSQYQTNQFSSDACAARLVSRDFTEDMLVTNSPIPSILEVYTLYRHMYLGIRYGILHVFTVIICFMQLLVSY